MDQRRALHSGRAAIRGLGVPEVAVIGLFVACAVVATAIPTPLLQRPSLTKAE
jgi:hypothetical protein